MTLSIATANRGRSESRRKTLTVSHVVVGGKPEVLHVPSMVPAAAKPKVTANPTAVRCGV